MKKIIFVLLFAQIIILPQELKFGWISNLSELSSQKVEIDSLIKVINSIEDIKFVVFSGKISTGTGRNSFSTQKDELDKLNCSYFVLPNSGELKNEKLLEFRELWYETDFYLKEDDKIFIGLTGENFLNDKKDTFTPETINRLKEEVKDTTKNVFLFLEKNLLKDFTNFEDLIKCFNNSKSLILFSASTEIKNEYNLQTLGFRKEAEKFSFVLGEILADTIELQRWHPDNKFTNIERTILDYGVKMPEGIEGERARNSDKIIFHKDFGDVISARPVQYEDKYVVCTRKGIISLLDSLGKTLWEYDAYGDITSTPVIADDKLITATRQGDLITLNLQNGEPLQTIGFDGYITSDILAIEYSGDKRLFIEKQSDSKTAVIFGTASGKIYCYDLETLQEYWSNDGSKNYILSSLMIEDNRLITFNSIGEIVCIDAKRGWTIWKWNESSKDDKNIYQYRTIISNNMLYVASTSGYVYGIDLLLGKVKWRSEKFRDCNAIALTPDKKNLLVKIYNEKLVIVAKHNGTNLNVIRYSNGYDNAFAAIFDDGKNIFLTSNSGEIFKIIDFKKSERIFELPGKLILDVLKVSPSRFLITTIDGQIILANFE